MENSVSHLVLLLSELREELYRTSQEQCKRRLVEKWRQLPREQAAALLPNGASAHCTMI